MLSFEEYLKSRDKSIEDTAKEHGLYIEVNQDYINAFVNGLNDYASSAEEEIKTMNYSNSSSIYNSRKTQYDKISHQGKKIKEWLDKQSNGKDYSTRVSEALEYLDHIYNYFNDANSFYTQFKTEDEYNSWMEEQEWRSGIDRLPESEDFEYYSKMGASVANPSWDDAKAPLQIGNWTPFGKGKEINNMVTFAETNASEALKEEVGGLNGGNVSEEAQIINLINLYAEPAEKATYNYYIGKGDKENADRYLTYLVDLLRQRQAGKIVEQADGNYREALFSSVAGLNSFGESLKNIGNFITGDAPDEESVIQYAHEQMSENNEGAWKVFNDLIYTTSNQVPSIVVGALSGGTAGAITMGVSAASNAYSEMRRNGYSDMQARNYGLLVGASESVLGKFLGGFSSIGGKHSLSSLSKNLVSGIDNALLRFAVKLPMNMVSEGLEESIQTILEPYFQSMTTGEEYTAAELSDILYSGLLGALSAGTIEGVGGSIGSIGESVYASRVRNGMSSTDYSDLLNEAKELNSLKDRKLSSLTQKYENKEKLSKWDVQKLIRSNEKVVLSGDKSKIKAGVKSTLESIGETTNIEPLSEAITKVVAGEELSRSDRKIIENSTYGADILDQLNPKTIFSNKKIESWEESTNPDDLASSLQDTEWAENLGTGIINKAAYNKGTGDIQNTDDKPLKSSASNVETDDEDKDEGGLESLSKKYGEQAQAMIHTYVEGQNVAQYDRDYKLAYDMGESGVSLSYALNSDTISYITENQVKLAYEAGKAAADTKAKAQDAKNKQAATGKTGRRKGTVQGRDVKIKDLKNTFNDTQNLAYKILVNIAEATGIDMVLYKSEVNANGDFEGAQGRFKWSEDKLYIDINAGLKSIDSVGELTKYAMLRTFSHEFTHFVEKWNPIWYNEFRKVIFEELTARGENVNDLIEKKQAANPGMSYDKASREVVAEAMTDILPDSHFVETLANKHKNIFEKLLAKLKEFLADIKAYFKAIVHNPSREANALKEQVGDAVHYVESIVELFDKVAVEAVENYQSTVAFEEKAENIVSAETKKAENIAPKTENKAKAEKTLFEKYNEIKQNFINQVMNGESVGRETEDTGEVTLSAAEVKALASGSPLIMEQVQLDTDIKKLESLYRAHLSSVRAAKERLVKDKGTIELLERMIDLGKSDMLATVDTYSEGKFSITVGKQKFTEKKDAGVALMAEATAKAVDTGYTTIGKFAGFDVRVIKTAEGIKGIIAGKQGYSFNTYPNNTTFMINHVISVVEGITEKVNMWNAQLSETKKDMAEQEKLIAEPFAKQTELDEKRKRYNEVMEILNPKEEQALDSADEDTVQEQSRDYLEDYTEEDYNNYGWARENEVLSAKENERLRSLFADAVSKQANPPRTKSGEYMIAIGEDVDNKIAYMKGEIDSPIITRILEIDEYNETKLDEIRRRVYATERTGIQRQTGGLFTLHTSTDSRFRYDQQRSDLQSQRYNDQLGTERARSRKTTSRVKEILFDDEGNEISRSYSDDVQYQQRSEGLTDREVLELAANEVKVSDLSQAENDALTIFQDRLANLKDLQEKRTEQGRLYKEQQFGAKPDREEASKTLNRMKILDEQIKKATADVLTVEEKEVLKRVLNKARKVVEEKEREHGQEILNRWRDRRNNAAAIKKYRDRLRGDVDELTNWIIGPNNKDISKHVPDVLKNSVIPFLSSINFMSKRSLKGGNATVSDKEFIKRLNALQSAIKTNIDVYGMYSGYNDLPADFLEKLQHFVSTTNVLLEKSAGEFIINQMTSAEIKELSQIVRTLKKYITQLNRFHNNAMYQHVYEAGDNSIDFLKELDNSGSHTGGFSNFVFWQQIRPAYAFERFGEGGKAIYDGLRQGQAKLAFNTKEIVSFTEKAYTAKEVKAWENELKEFSLGRDIVKIPVANIMSFYELTKDPEAKAHIDGGGIRVATYTRKGKKISDVGHILTVGEFNQIIGSLTDRQRAVADALQKFMAEQGGKWGNYVSVARFGEELFTNPHYFPINSDGRHLSATVEEHPSAAALYALLNMSFTKSRKEGANNRIVLYSIFDVFANHMASMAQYNAMALPILDALKWFNYQQVFIDDEGNKTVTASVREQMSRTYGVPDETKPGSGKQGYAETFIVNIIKSFNGTAAQGTPYDTLGLKSLHAYNIAQVAYNLRVVVQQPLAITRAGMLLSFRSILKGFKLKPSKVKQNIEEMQKYSGIAAWKSLGFYDVNISRGLTHLIKHDTGVFEKISNVGMWGAEKADLMTWAAIWGAAKAEVTKTQHLTPESEGFYEAVSKLFEDVIYKTQVVDSILTKNEFMRDKGTFARLVGSFMSEATTNASMLIDAVDKYHLDMKRGMSKREAWLKNKRYIGRTLYVFGIGAVLLAAVQAVIDADRDDDEYEEYYEKWLEQFGGNLIDELMPFNKLPIISDFYDLAKSLLSAVGVDTYGNPPSSVFMQWYDSLVKGTEIIYDKISGEDTNYTWYGGIYKLLQAVSGMSGLPLGSATREIITFWNNIAGVMAPSLKVKTYESSELSQIKYAYEDGYLSYEEAVNLLLEKGLADNENEAYFIISGWEAGEGYSKYDAIFDAVRNGGDFNAAMDELTSHGYSEKEVLSQVKSKIGEWYQGGEISKSQAENMLRKYSDLISDEITATVNKWSSYVVTGIKYEDIDDEYMEGNITASRAIDMYVRYGSMTREKATEKVTVLEFVKENPSVEGISYSAVSAYKQYCEPSGVPVKIYYEAWKHKNTLSGSVKESMMDYINSLSLSARQKDSLYFAFGYAESKLYEAPWR